MLVIKYRQEMSIPYLHYFTVNTGKKCPFRIYSKVVLGALTCLVTYFNEFENFAHNQF